jgi:hypothetical protein
VKLAENSQLVNRPLLSQQQVVNLLTTSTKTTNLRRCIFMMYAKKIKMQQGCSTSNNTQHIDEIYVDGCNNPGFFSRTVLHDHLVKNPNSIKVNIAPNYPYLIPATSVNNAKYVRSEANDTPHDNLLKLPRI